jgi:uncharacterized protein
MKYSKSSFLILSFALLFVNTILSQTLYIPEKPSFIPPIIDSTKTLSEFEKEDLYQKLKIYSDSTSTEILVMIVPTTRGELIARYATDLGHKWGIGQKGKDNGIVFLIAKDDRKMTIQGGYGVEHLLTDAMSRRIIEEVIKPEFKANNYYNGIDQGTKAIFQVLKGEYKNDVNNQEISILPILLFIIIFFIIIILLSKNKGNNDSSGSGRFSGPDLSDIIILSRMGRGGGSWDGGGSSGGSWGGFGGGGSFGGGGASGSW